MKIKKIALTLMLFLAQPSFAQNYCDVHEANRLAIKYKKEGLSALISESERCKSNCGFKRYYLIATNEIYCSKYPCVRLKYIEDLTVAYQDELKNLRICPSISKIIKNSTQIF